MADFSAKEQLCSCYFHRGITIEGAVSLENVLDLIDWAPKVGYNAYFIQFMDGYQFFDRWYSHEENPFRKPEPYSREDCKVGLQQVIAQIKKRDMMLHAVGHGWTSAALQIDAGGWYEADDRALSSNQRAQLAQIDGKRVFYKGKPLNTQLCYAQKKNRMEMIKQIVHYARNNPYVDYLHIWLADDFNNFCECDLCRQQRPADQYIRLLNELDEALKKENLPIKIVFLAYYELLWPPLKERIHNTERFTLMIAPIFRTHTQAYEKAQLPANLPAYVRNQIVYPRENGVYLLFLKEWRNAFVGDCFSFEYHLMWDQYRDIGQRNLAKVLYSDIKTIKQYGLNGILSCQLNRCAFPTAFPNYMMGHALLSDCTSFEALEQEYLEASFGDCGAAVKTYLKEIGQLFSFSYHADLEQADKNLIERLKKVRLCTQNILQCEVSVYADDSCVQHSWKILKLYAMFYQELADLLVWKLQQDAVPFDELYKRWRLLMDQLWAQEPVLQSAADMFYFNFITKEYVFRGYHEQLQRLESLGKQN